MKTKSHVETTSQLMELLDFGIKSKPKRQRVIALLLYFVQHKGSFICKRKMSSFLGLTERSLYRYLKELKRLIPLQMKSGMYRFQVN